MCAPPLHCRSAFLLGAGQEAGLRKRHDVAIARAVAELRVLAELCLPLVRVGGHWVAAKGPAPHEEVAAAGGALTKLGGKLLAVAEVDSGGCCLLLPGGSAAGCYCRQRRCCGASVLNKVMGLPLPPALANPACPAPATTPAACCRGPRGAAHRCGCAQGQGHSGCLPTQAGRAWKEAAVRGPAGAPLQQRQRQLQQGRRSSMADHLDGFTGASSGDAKVVTNVWMEHINSRPL